MKLTETSAKKILDFIMMKIGMKRRFHVIKLLYIEYDDYLIPVTYALNSACHKKIFINDDSWASALEALFEKATKYDILVEFGCPDNVMLLKRGTTLEQILVEMELET